MKWVLYIGQLILALTILTVTYVMARWQASDLIDEINWKIEHGMLKKGEIMISRVDELMYVAKHYPSTIIIMTLCLFYMMLVYRYWKHNKIAV